MKGNFTMKHQNHEVMHQFIRKEILDTASQLNLTNEEVSERLGITSRNYSNIKAGKYSCSMETMSSYIVNLCTDKTGFLERLEKSRKRS